MFSMQGNWKFFGVSKGDDRGKAANFNGSAWSHTSPTPQSTSDCMQSIRGLLAATFSMGKLAFFGVSKGDDRGDMSQQGAQFQWIRMVTHLTHTTINKWLRWGVLNGPGDCWQIHFLYQEIGVFWCFERGRIEGTFYNTVANCSGSAWSHTSPTPQSTSDCIGADRIDQKG